MKTKSIRAEATIVMPLVSMSLGLDAFRPSLICAFSSGSVDNFIVSPFEKRLFLKCVPCFPSEEYQYFEPSNDLTRIHVTFASQRHEPPHPSIHPISTAFQTLHSNGYLREKARRAATLYGGSRIESTALLFTKFRGLRYTWGEVKTGKDERSRLSKLDSGV